MDFTEITLQDKAFFDGYLKKHNVRISELTFTNLFAWRHHYKFRYTVMGGLLCLVAAPLKSRPFAMMPVGEVNTDSFAQALEGLRAYFRQKEWGLEFKKIAKDELVFFQDYVNSESDMVYDRDNSDYVYLASDLINLKGKKFDGKRNHINKFKKNHTYEYVPLNSPSSPASDSQVSCCLAGECHDTSCTVRVGGDSTGLVTECLKILEDWHREKVCVYQEDDRSESCAIVEMLSNIGTLGCRGALIKVDGEFHAFTIGEMLNSDTAVIHIEKANAKIDGLYTIINQKFCEQEWSGAVYINREQDLGGEGMRKAKLSYHPAAMVDKYTVLL